MHRRRGSTELQCKAMKIRYAFTRALNGAFILLVSFGTSVAYSQEDGSPWPTSTTRPRQSATLRQQQQPNPAVGFSTLAEGLDLSVRGNNCQYTRMQLTERDPILTFSSFDYSKAWDCLEVIDHISSDVLMSGCRPDPKLVLPFDRSRPPRINKREISGYIQYVNAIPKPYRYDIETAADGNLQISVRVGFVGEIADDPVIRKLMRDNLEQAALIWESHSPNERIHFKFDLVTEEANPHLLVNLKEQNTRGPYNSEWSTRWSATSIAHELGHAMGLNDEYDQIRTTFQVGTIENQSRCNWRSLMCFSGSGSPRSYHYYVIARRAWCHQETISHLYDDLFE